MKFSQYCNCPKGYLFFVVLLLVLQSYKEVAGDYTGGSPQSSSIQNPNNCPRPNEVWSSEGNWCCQPTCQHPSAVCNKMCMLGGGCFCAEGYKRDESRPGSPCVPAGECPPALPNPPTQHTCTGENEVWQHCKMQRCERSCADRNPLCLSSRIGIVCLPSMDVGQCECMGGYIRETPEIGARCIPEGNCPPLIEDKDENCPNPQTEQWAQCANGCEPSCENPTPICPFLCPANGGCRCRAPLVRYLIPGGKCVSLESCPNAQSGNSKCPNPNEMWSECDRNSCEPSCALTNPICTMECRSPGSCTCVPGTVRMNGPGTECIPASQCQNNPAINE